MSTSVAKKIGLDEKDADAIKSGCASTWHKFVDIVDRFTDMIFSRYS